MDIFVFRILLVLYRKEYSSTLNTQGLEMMNYQVFNVCRSNWFSQLFNYRRLRQSSQG